MVNPGLSLQQILANLEAQMDLHREREAHHAREEEAHREQRALHAAELETLARHYEALKSSAEAAAPLVARYVPAPPPSPKEPPQETLPPDKHVTRRHLVERVVAEMPKGEVFSPTSIAAAVNRRFRNLPKPAEPRMASAVLRRLVDEGWIRLAQKGTSHREATYTKV
jgi:hypothetical protein